MGAINIDNSGSGSSVTLKSDGTSLLLNGTAVGGSSATKVISNQIAAYTVVSGDLGKIINCTSGTFTVSLTAAASLGSGFTCTIWNTGTGAITIDPNAAETIDGVATLVLQKGEGLAVVCNGTTWETDNKKPMRGYAENLANTSTRPIASGTNAISISYNSTSSGNGSIALGGYCNASGGSAVAIGNSAVSSNTGSVSIGYSSTANGQFGISIGGNTTAGTTGTAIGNSSSLVGSVTNTGAGAMALGGSYASGTDSFAAAIANNTNTYGATGAGGIAIGTRAKAAGINSVALGLASQATANYAVVISTGLNNGSVASSLSAIAIGDDSLSSNYYAVALGFRALSTTVGKFSYASGTFSARGDAQFGKIILRASTTTTTAVVLTSDADPAGTPNQLIVATNQAMTFFGTLIAKQSASANMASYMIKGAIVNNAGTVSISTISIDKIVDTIGLTTEPTYTADNTNKGLTVTSGAKLTTNIRWVCNLDSVEVTYA
jgi:hypothetical protein